MQLADYLGSCRELGRLCRRNGWIDTASLAVQIIQRDARHLVAVVGFDEVIAQSAHVVERMPRWGRVYLELQPSGEVVQIKVL